MVTLPGSGRKIIQKTPRANLKWHKPVEKLTEEDWDSLLSGALTVLSKGKDDAEIPDAITEATATTSSGTDEPFDLDSSDEWSSGDEGEPEATIPRFRPNF